MYVNGLEADSYLVRVAGCAYVVIGAAAYASGAMRVAWMVAAGDPARYSPGAAAANPKRSTIAT